MLRLVVCTFAFFLSIPQFLLSHSPFVVVTPEKTGTHLLTKALERLVDKTTINHWIHTASSQELIAFLDQAEENNVFIQMHALPTPEIIDTLRAKHYKVIFLMRDPRDVAVSLLHYIEKGWAYGPCRNDMAYGKLSLDEKLDELITGSRFGCAAVKEVIGLRIPWLHQDPSFVYSAHFENLVGTAGGGSDDLQNLEIANIANHLSIFLTSELLEKVTTDLFGAPGTFRSGQIGSWKSQFSDQHVASFKMMMGINLIILGYEKGFSWTNHH